MIVASGTLDHVGHAIFVLFRGRPVYRIETGLPMSVFGLQYRTEDGLHDARRDPTRH